MASLSMQMAAGYFHRILASPKDSFLTLARFPEILGLELEHGLTYLEKDRRVAQVDDTLTSNQNNSIVAPADLATWLGVRTGYTRGN